MEKHGRAAASPSSPGVRPPLRLSGVGLPMTSELAPPSSQTKSTGSNTGTLSRPRTSKNVSRSAASATLLGWKLGTPSFRPRRCESTKTASSPPRAMMTPSFSSLDSCARPIRSCSFLSNTRSPSSLPKPPPPMARRSGVGLLFASVFWGSGLAPPSRLGAKEGNASKSRLNSASTDGPTTFSGASAQMPVCKVKSRLAVARESKTSTSGRMFLVMRSAHASRAAQVRR
mmetsp:Transcript_3107/g.7965  ORF Transcript_3107/g.7965 Transcript_3107/m.7965 type:complete len:229 (-) Transcript_3107:1244-1930(-)